MATQAVLFDLDGTLLDTAPDMRDAANAVLCSLGYPEISMETARQYSSDGSLGLLQQGLGDDYSRFAASELRQHFLDAYQLQLNRATRLFPGIEHCLNWLIGMGIPWGVVTNKPARPTHALLTDFAIFKQAAVVIAGDTLDKRKPHPKPLLHAAEQIGVAPSACSYFGDAERDIQAANAAGMTSVVALWGYLREDSGVNDWQAHHQCATSEQLSHWIEQTLTL
ncbi:phosphoglycolate phosphatase [Aliagarivorans marinus]|uniref:phosphoglycolate phosphatase n=1 Tax=Aliagarivorans marinus TaxID=561965 RepID=UPI0004182A4D|nr:phosphoglycolate phosphatase [Aliagarivorans marinus]